MKVTAIIPAAGIGKRMNAKKQFLEIAGLPVLVHTVKVMNECQVIDEIIIAVPKDDIESTKELVKDFVKVKAVVVGGEERQDSVYNGLKAVEAESVDDIIVIHDAARPLITKEIISSAVMEAKVSKAVIVGVPAKDTIKMVSEDNEVIDTLERNKIWLIQTPQVFHYTLIKEAYDRAEKVGYRATDDSRLVERLGIKVKVVMGSYDNIKITTKEDLHVAQVILNGRTK
jgi:2-C-methyl-D-erythritol 4-phosphate cytidylyltransferase